MEITATAVSYTANLFKRNFLPWNVIFQFGKNSDLCSFMLNQRPNLVCQKGAVNMGLNLNFSCGRELFSVDWYELRKFTGNDSYVPSKNIDGTKIPETSLSLRMPL